MIFTGDRVEDIRSTVSNEASEASSEAARPRIIICGLGRTGLTIFHLLRRQGANVMAISLRAMPGEDGARVTVGDPRHPPTLIAAGIREARTIVLAHGDDALNLAVLTQARVLNPRIQVVNRLLNQTLGDRLDQTLPGHISTSVASLAAPIFAFSAFGQQAIGQLRLFGRPWPVREEIIDADHPWLGQKLADLWDDRTRMLIGFFPAGGRHDNLIEAVVEGRMLLPGDRLVVGTQPRVPSQREARWRKLLKAITHVRRLHHHAGSVLAVTATLLATIAVSATIYVAAASNAPFIDALYFTVGMITGAGGQEQIAENASAAIKVFTAVMMLVGAGIIGVCYALINDFILGSRFKQFWDAARVPASHHYIVCGLGGLGIQTVRQLIDRGCEVVAIERDPKCRFLHAAAALGVPVIVADASLNSTLKAANIASAEAILAVTSDAIANVEISLTAKAMQADIPAIVRHHDPEFARSVQKVFGFETVLCPHEIAAPSFATAALGGRAIGNGLVGDLLWIAIAIDITETHPFRGRDVQTTAAETGFVPLYLNSRDNTVHGWQLLQATLHPGDTLYVMLPATRLEQLWQVQPPSLYCSRHR